MVSGGEPARAVERNLRGANAASAVLAGILTRT